MPSPRDPALEAAVRRSRARDRHVASVHELLEVRADLRGVHPLADVLHHAALESA